ncbi:MAG: heme o synthase [Phycisphaerales bacterium]
MSRSAPATVIEAIEARSRLQLARAKAGAVVEASKPGITRLVTITSAVGFALAAAGRRWEAGELAVVAVACLLGTALSAAGANTLNQWMERARDARMPRTQRRPIPRGSLSPTAAKWAGVAMAALGVVVLWAGCGWAPAAVSAITTLIYLFAYTPLKPVTPWATLVGAVPGALPPVIGYTAGAGPAGFGEPMAWLLFLIMFVWQVPHFLAIAWLYREDYEAGGFRVLPVVDPTGRRTARSILAWSVALIPVSIAPAFWMDAAPGAAFGIITGIMGVAFLMLGLRLVRTQERADARRAFFASIIHLPLLLIAVVAFSLVSTIA